MIQLSGQENGFVTNVNHNVAKALVNFADQRKLEQMGSETKLSETI